jgi:hypothetical protein
MPRPPLIITAVVTTWRAAAPSTSAGTGPGEGVRTWGAWLGDPSAGWALYEKLPWENHDTGKVPNPEELRLCNYLQRKENTDNK